MKAKLAAFLMLTCGSYTLMAQSLSKPYHVSGHLENLKTTNGYVYLRGKLNGRSTTDSVKVTDGNFVFSGSAEPAMVKLFTPRLGHAHYINPIDFFLDGTNVRVTATYDTTQYTYFKNVRITGSPSQDEFIVFGDQQKKLIEGSGIDLRKLQDDYKNAEAVKDTAAISNINKRYAIFNVKRNESIANYIKEHPKSFVSLEQINNMVAVPDEKTLKIAGSLFLTLDPSLQFSDRGKKITERMQFAAKGMIVNKAAEDFSQPTASGKVVKLSDYKGKYVLLDFWASWCGPCRAENPNVLKNYKQYKDKGFDVLAVSLDNNAEKWKKAIKEDQLPWVQVSDLKQTKNAAAQQFGVLAIPDNFLIDPNGVVIARGLRGEALDKKLAEVLSK